jgi:hypothetical protein
MLLHGKGRKVSEAPFGDELADALDAPTARHGPVLAHVRSASGLRYRIVGMAYRARYLVDMCSRTFDLSISRALVT